MKKRFYIELGFIGLITTGAIAQENLTPVVDAESHDLTPMQVTAGRQASRTQDTATAVTVIDTQEPDAAAQPLLADLLRGQTGIFIQQTTPGQATPIIRGLKGSQVLNLVDGMRLNNALFRNAPNQYLALVDPFWVDHAEVVRGPASTLYGGDAMGGVLNVITKTPVPGGKKHQGHIQRSLDTADLHNKSNYLYEYSGENSAWMAALTKQKTGSRDTGDDRVPNSGFESYSAFLKGVYFVGQDSEWMFNLQYLTQPETPRIDELVTGFGQTEPASEVFNFEPNNRLFTHVRFQNNLDMAFADHLDVHYAYQRIDDDRRTRDTGSEWESRERNRSSMHGLTVQLEKELPGLSWIYGLESWMDTVHSSRFQRNVLTEQLRDKNSRFPEGSSMDSYAAFLETQFKLSDGWQIGAGLRYSSYDIQLPAADRGLAASLSPSDFTGHFQVVKSLHPNINWVSNVGKGFRPPNIYDLSTLGERPGNRYNIASEDLSAESLLSFDTGLKFAFSNLQGEVFLWQSRYEDKISSVATGELTETGRIIVQSQNIGQVDLHGIEAGLQYQHEDWGHFQSSLNWVYGTEKEPDGSNIAADRIPPLNARISWKKSLGSWDQKLTIRWAASQDRLSERDIRDPRIDPTGTAEWATLNWSGSRQLKTNWLVTLKVGNLTNTTYREHGSGIDAPGRNFGLIIGKQF